MEAAETIFVSVFALVVYFAPTISARLRKHHSSAAIFMTNLLLGWSGIGWVVALIWSWTKVVPQR